VSKVQSLIDSRTYSDNIPHPRQPETQNFFTADPNLRYLMKRYLPPSMHDWAESCTISCRNPAITRRTS
jgi:acyl-CoA dehydrogenase